MFSAHQYLCETLHILHRDISIGNILLYRAEEGQEATGLLVDFDFAMSFPDPEASESVPHNSVLSDAVNEDVAADEVAASDDDSDESMSTSDIDDRIWTVSANPH